MKETIAQNKKFVGVTVLLVITGAITSMVTPLIIQYVNSQKIPISYQVLMIISLFMGVSFILQLCLLIFRENFAADFNVNYLFRLLEKLITINYDALVKKEATYLVNRVLIAVETLYLFLTMGFATVIEAVFIIVISLSMIFFTSGKLFLILFFLLPLNFFGFKYINQRLAIKMAAMQTQSAVATKDLIVALSNADNVKAQGNLTIIENLLKPQIQTMYQTLANTNKYAQGTSATISFINQLVQNITYVWASIQIVNQKLPISSLMILSIVIPMYYDALRNLTKVNIDYKSLVTANDFVRTDLTENQEKDGEKIIERITHVTFDNPSFLLNDKHFSYQLNDSLKTGDIAYLEGGSGSGKSSLLRLLLKFRQAEGLTLNDEPISLYHNTSLRDTIGYVSQDTLIFSTTLEENLSLGGPLSTSQKELIERSGILNPILKDKTWATPLFENGANLSGGEKQRIMICRVMLKKSSLLILDESISNIDRESAHDILTFLTSYGRDKIIIYTSHDRSFEKYATKILTLN